jgi:hypothetical protein
MTTNESRFYDTADRIRAIHDRFPDGLDPEFDGGVEDLEHLFAELRFTLNHD